MISSLKWMEAWLVEVKDNFSYLPAFIQGAIIVSLTAIVCTVLAYLGLLLLRGVKHYQDKRELPVACDIDTLMLDHIINRSMQEPAARAMQLPLDGFRKLPLHRRWCRELLVQKILHYRRHFSGEVSGLFRRLYLELGLHERPIRDLSGSPKKVVKALNELYNMEMLADEARILPLVNSPNRYVREKARCYLAKCATTQPLEFLGKIEKPLLLWEQFELFRILSQRTDIPVPSFANWMNPAFHPSVNSFCLKMAAHFQQPAAIPAIMALLKTENEALRAQAINSLGKLMAEEAEPVLVAMYNAQPPACKMEILKALGRIGSGRELAFLQKEFLEAERFELKKHAARSLVSHKALAQPLLEQLLEQSVGQQHVILQHSLNPLIKY